MQCNLVWLFSGIIIVLLGLGGVAFVTLLERKLLSLTQMRLGPNKVTFVGLLQPVGDGIKLLFKESYVPMYSQSILYMFFSWGLLLFFLVLWGVVMEWGEFLIFSKALVFLSVLGSGTYFVMMSSWASTSSFSKLGSMRSMLQGLSFEVSLVLVFFISCLAFYSLTFSKVGFKEEISVLWAFLWIFLMLMDTNRAPFDLLEGESELISGFNIEMGSLLFVFIFLSEYGMLMISSLVGSLCWSGSMFKWSFVLISLFLLVRSCYPRLRYDIVSGVMWQSILSVGLVLFFLFFILR